MITAFTELPLIAQFGAIWLIVASIIAPVFGYIALQGNKQKDETLTLCKE